MAYRPKKLQGAKAAFGKDKESYNTIRRIRNLLRTQLKGQLVNDLRDYMDENLLDGMDEYIPEDTGDLKESFDWEIDKRGGKFNFTFQFSDLPYAHYQNTKSMPVSKDKDYYVNHPWSIVFKGLSKPQAGSGFLNKGLEVFEENLKYLVDNTRRTLERKYSKK